MLTGHSFTDATAGLELRPRAQEAAATTRFNREAWARARPTDADSAIIPNLETTRARCRYEFRENGWAAGIVRTYTHDVVGRDGPGMRVTLERGTDDRDFVEFARDAWYEWCERADTAGLPFAEVLGESVGQFWCAGEFITQLVTAASNRSGVTLRLHCIAPERLATPHDLRGDPAVRGGVRIGDYGEPVEYMILDDVPGSQFGTFRSTYKVVPAASVLHVYRREEPGQTRGEPWFGPVIDTFRQARAFLQDTLTAARSAALMGAAVLRTSAARTQDGEASPEILDIPPGSMMIVPPDGGLEQIKPEHPSTMFSDFFRVLLGLMGRPGAMPYIRVASDAGKHNFSSARLDLQTYWIGVEYVRGWIERVYLRPIAMQVIREAALVAKRRLPGRLWLDWTWDAIPHIDELSAVQAATERLRSGLSSLERESQNFNSGDWEELAEQRRLEKERLAELGVTPQEGAPLNGGNAGNGIAGDDAVPGDDGRSAVAGRLGVVGRREAVV